MYKHLLAKTVSMIVSNLTYELIIKGFKNAKNNNRIGWNTGKHQDDSGWKGNNKGWKGSTTKF